MSHANKKKKSEKKTVKNETKLFFLNPNTTIQK